MAKKAKKEKLIEWEGNEYPADKYRVRSGQLYSELSGEPANLQRAEWANTAVSAFVNEVGENDDHTDLGDLLGDLMHWADRQGVDFGAAFRSGRGHYEEECSQENTAPQRAPLQTAPERPVPPSMLQTFLTAMEKAEGFISGFEDDETQEDGVPLPEVRAAIALCKAALGVQPAAIQQAGDGLTVAQEIHPTGLTCPKCGYAGDFSFTWDDARLQITSDGGLDGANGGVEWSECNSVSCGGCGHEGGPAEFAADISE